MTVGELTGIQPGQDEREDVRGAGEPVAAAGGNASEQEPTDYFRWSDVPFSLACRSQLAKADLPREPGGPVRGYLKTSDWRGKKDWLPLFAVSESVPTGATGGQLAAAERRSSAVRECGECGARCQQPLHERDDGRHLCLMCGKIARVRERQAQLRERRGELAVWARQLLDAGGLAIVWVTVHEAPLTPGGRRRPPLAARVHVVDEAGQRLADVLVRLAGPRAAGVPEGALPADEGVAALDAAFSGRRAVLWTDGGLETVTARLAALGHPLEPVERVRRPVTWNGPGGGSWSGQVRDCLAQWRGELRPDTGELLVPWPPGTADRLWLALARIAAGAAEDG
ncbi:hypothetical protein [Streptomyces sp. MP131-18]|uniref:hypothetical protein n=1 Tax=Streptomyces sp. MP131-18 TaxID=1857892 RepID=UPI00097C82A1|nr:hypothetical protein [Streptomyces sp. MP131-18]ONK09244.1 hypothetical protein STBA_70990 [Streptomyces sp. MP131-18]